jgi:hypothetical protein
MIQRSYRAEYPKLGTPSHSTINNLISKNMVRWHMYPQNIKSRAKKRKSQKRPGKTDSGIS